jgi:hypothetical protein
VSTSSTRTGLRQQNNALRKETTLKVDPRRLLIFKNYILKTSKKKKKPHTICLIMATGYLEHDELWPV